MGLRILLADDCSAILRSVQTLLEHDGHEVVGLAEDGREAVRLAIELAPDIAILDLSMPIMNGISAAREIHQASPQTGLILLSIHAGEELIVTAMRAGILACVSKGDAGDDLLRAVREVAQGDTFLSATPSRILLDNLLGH